MLYVIFLEFINVRYSVAFPSNNFDFTCSFFSVCAILIIVVS